ncbi:hypothetical protein Ccrd_013629 [Cynara cardunculus var. scolymus]|uniref:Uncharacterized protein n=1 Tax=Cynara cardunculus var. scolymus TaxID=59895 RepID=A0A103YF87_CYNCS|nr:hypothetical protein Ccrd_013629 [Cynara cardunculus var. scolymus]
MVTISLHSVILNSLSCLLVIIRGSSSNSSESQVRLVYDYYVGMLVESSSKPTLSGSIRKLLKRNNQVLGQILANISSLKLNNMNNIS